MGEGPARRMLLPAQVHCDPGSYYRRETQTILSIARLYGRFGRLVATQLPLWTTV